MHRYVATFSTIYACMQDKNNIDGSIANLCMQKTLTIGYNFNVRALCTLESLVNT